MKIQLRIDCTNATNTFFTVFLDGASCGRLCARNDEFRRFATIIKRGANLANALNADSFRQSGSTWDEVQQAKAALMGESR